MIFFDELPLATVGTTIKAKSYQIEAPDVEGVWFGAVGTDGAAQGTMNRRESYFLTIAVGNPGGDGSTTYDENEDGNKDGEGTLDVRRTSVILGQGDALPAE